MDARYSIELVNTAMHIRMSGSFATQSWAQWQQQQQQQRAAAAAAAATGAAAASGGSDWHAATLAAAVLVDCICHTLSLLHCKA
jgi:hypothetical protein